MNRAPVNSIGYYQGYLCIKSYKKRREKWAERLFEELMAPNFLNVIYNINV